MNMKVLCHCYLILKQKILNDDNFKRKATVKTDYILPPSPPKSLPRLFNSSSESNQKLYIRPSSFSSLCLCTGIYEHTLHTFNPNTYLDMCVTLPMFLYQVMPSFFHFIPPGDHPGECYVHVQYLSINTDKRRKVINRWIR